MSMGQDVYFARCIAANGMDMQAVKIGCSYGHLNRVASIGLLLPFHCELIGAIPGCMLTEDFIHMWLDAEKIGGEYFHARGETLRVVEHVRLFGSLPSDMRGYQSATDIDTIAADIAGFMRRNRITFEDTERLAGVRANYHRRLIEREPHGNRRFIAALAVTAVRKGLAISWPDHFKPRAQKAKPYEVARAA